MFESALHGSQNFKRYFHGWSLALKRSGFTSLKEPCNNNIWQTRWMQYQYYFFLRLLHCYAPIQYSFKLAYIWWKYVTAYCLPPFKHDIHDLTDEGTAIGSGINNIGVKRRIRYLRHFRRVFATEAFFLWGKVRVEHVDPSSLLAMGPSCGFSSTGTDGRQARFVVPISIVFSWFAEQWIQV